MGLDLPEGLSVIWTPLGSELPLKSMAFGHLEWHEGLRTGGYRVPELVPVFSPSELSALEQEVPLRV